MTAYDRWRDRLEEVGSQTKDQGERLQAQCPAHDDQEPSLSITKIEGEVLAYCHAGCSTDDILESLNFGRADFYDEPRGRTYTYSDGRTVHRTPDKKFRQTGNTKGTALYRAETLPQRPEAHVYVAEGEKDVHALESIGATAVCPAMGAGKATRFDWSPLAGRDVTIVADDDTPGHKHASKIHELLTDHARSITIAVAKTGKDAADHVAAGHTLGDLQPIDLAPAGRRLKVTLGTNVKTRKVEWLKPDWIPRSAITLLAGREGFGKSTIAVAWVAEQTQLGHYVIYIHTEDSREHTVAPRLKAAGADMSKVLFIDVETETSDSGTITLPFDNGALEKIVEQYKVTFMVLDAATSSMSSEISGKDDRQVRQFLEPLAQMAARQNMVVLGLVHFGKRDGADSGKLILGSIAWSQVARSVLSLAWDDENEHLVLTNTKGNLATRVRSEALQIVSKTVDTEDGPTEVGAVAWLGETNQDARDLLSGDDRDDDRSEVEAVVVDYLESQGGSAAAGDVLKATRAAGLSDNAVKKSRKKIGVTTRKAGMGAGWVWTLNAPKVPEGAEDSHAREWAPSAPSGESSEETTEPAPLPPALTVAPEPLTEAQREVLGSLHPEHGLTIRALTGSISPRWRDQLSDLLAPLISDGLITVDSDDKFYLAERISA